MDENKKENRFAAWLSSNQWIWALIVGLLAFVGLAMPLINTHGATYDPATWGFSETWEDRINLGAEMLFGGNGAVNWPTIVIYVLILLGCILLVVGYLTKKSRIFNAISLILFLISGVLLLVSNNFYGFVNAQATVGDAAKNTPYFEGEYYNDNYYWYVKHYIATCDSRLSIGSMWSCACAFAAGLLSFVASMAEEKVNVREITEIGVLTAAAIGLDVIFHYIPNVPGQVGSISIALLPLYVISLRHGPIKGFLASAVIYGLITCMTDGYGLFLYPLDYFVGYASVAVIGLFRPFIFSAEQKTYNVKGIVFIVLGIMLGSVVRLIGSGTSSIVNYGYTVTAALVANLYIVISSAICAVIVAALYRPLIVVNKHFPVSRSIADIE